MPSSAAWSVPSARVGDQQRFEIRRGELWPQQFDGPASADFDHARLAQ